MDAQSSRMRLERHDAVRRSRRRRATATVAATVAVVTMSLGAGGVGAEAKGWVPPKAPTVKPVKPVKPVMPVTSSQVPRGAKFRCRDGSYSFVSKPALACWGHGGVAAQV